MQTNNSLYFNQKLTVQCERDVFSFISYQADKNTTKYKIQDFTKDACISISFSLQNEKHNISFLLQNEKHNYLIKLNTLLKMMEVIMSRLSQDIKENQIINLIKKDFYQKNNDANKIGKNICDLLNSKYIKKEKRISVDIELVSLIYLEKGKYNEPFKAYHLITGENLNKKINYDIMNEFFNCDVCLQILNQDNIYLNKKSFNQYLLYRYSETSSDYHSLMDETLDNDDMFSYHKNERIYIENILKDKNTKVYFNDINSSRWILDKHLRY